MLFREALRNGFFEMQRSRDKYRELCGVMRKDLVTKFIEWQVLVLAPICPHISEHMWAMLGNKGSIMKAKWPETGKVDEICIKKSEYLMEATRDFRLKLKAYLQPPKAKKNAPAPPEKPTHATAFVAKTFPPWQCTVLTTLREMYDANKDGSPPDNKLISQELAKKAELKKFMKKVMPFVQFTKERVAAVGKEALDLTLDFDEKAVLEENGGYIANSLGLEGIDVLFSSEAGNEKTQEECRPGAPFVQFRKEPSVDIQMINNQPHTGHFSTSVPVLAGDDVRKVIRRLAAAGRGIKEGKVSLFRYEDPVMGPRRMPNVEKQLEGLVKVQASDKFAIDLQKSSVTLKEKDFGKVLIYRVEA